MNKQSNTVKFIYFGATLTLIFSFSCFVLEKTRVTNFYSKPSVTQDTSIRPVNVVEYTVADPTDNDEINQKKADGTLGASNSAPAGEPINVVLTAAGQDTAGGPVIVKVLLTDVTSGNCDITLNQNEVTKSYSTSVISAGNYYTCDGFEIPLEDISVGSWNLTATVTSAERTGTTTQKVEVQ
jgi:hypothetical protein